MGAVAFGCRLYCMCLLSLGIQIPGEIFETKMAPCLINVVILLVPAVLAATMAAKEKGAHTGTLSVPGARHLEARPASSGAGRSRRRPSARRPRSQKRRGPFRHKADAGTCTTCVRRCASVYIYIYIYKLTYMYM